MLKTANRAPRRGAPALRTLSAAALLFSVLSFGTALQAAETPGAVYVDIRESESAQAPVVERWKLYGASYALVIGNDNYTQGWPRLANAVRDAREVAEALRGKGFQVDLLTNVTGDKLRRSLREFFALKGADPQARLFVWYAGHGHTEFGEGYLVPVDAPTPERPEFLVKALHMGDVGSMVRIARAKHVLSIFDSCFAGTVFSGQRSRPPAAVTSAAVQPVRQFLTSGDADQEVSDDGTFRRLFLRALRGEEAADANRDGYLTATELSLHLEDRVTNLTQAAQTPRSGKLRDPRFDRGDFIFLLPQAADRTQTTALPAQPKDSMADDTVFELEFWNAVKDSDQPGDYHAYLEAYPNGRFAPLARRRAAALAASAEPAAVPQPAPAETAAEDQEHLLPSARDMVSNLGDGLAGLTGLSFGGNDEAPESQGGSQQAGLPPPDAPAVKSRDEVSRYLSDNKHRMRSKLWRYNNESRIAPSDQPVSTLKVHSMRVERVAGARAFVRISYSAKINWNSTAHKNLLFELKWVDDKLVFVGHTKG